MSEVPRSHLRPRVSDPMGVLMEAFLPASPAPSQPHGAHKAPEGHIVVPARRVQTGVGQIAPQAVARLHERPMLARRVKVTEWVHGHVAALVALFPAWRHAR